MTLGHHIKIQARKTLRPDVCFSTVGGVTGLDNLSQNIHYAKPGTVPVKGRYVQTIS